MKTKYLLLCLALAFPAAAQLYIPPAQRPYYLVASAYAPARVKAMANYVCDGVNDEVQIQAAIDALPTGIESGRYNGGEVVLSQGQFNIGAQVKLRAQMILSGQGTYGTTIRASTPMQAKGCGTVVKGTTGGTGYSVGDIIKITGGGGTNAYFKVLTLVGATSEVDTLEMLATGTNYAVTTGAATTRYSGAGSGCVVNITHLCHEDLFGMEPTNNGFLQIRDVFIHGSKLAPSGTNSNTYLCSANQITGLIPYGNPGANMPVSSTLYLKMLDDDPTHHHIEIYSDAARTTGLIGHTATFVSATVPALQTIIADNDSGLGGKIGLKAAPDANTDYTDLVLAGSTKGCAINLLGFDSHIQSVMVMYAAEDGIRASNSWGLVVDDVIVEFCYGHGINLTGAYGSGHAKINQSKLQSNSGSALVIGRGSPYSLVTGCEMYGGDTTNLGLDVAPATGIQVNSNGCVISGCQFVVNYPAFHAASTLTTYGYDTKFVGCHFLGNAGASIYGINANAGYTSATGCTFRNFSGTSSYAYVMNSYEGSATGNQFAACTNGITIGGTNRCNVTGNVFGTCTTGVGTGGGSGNVVSSNVFDTCPTGVSVSSGASNLIVSGNTFYAGAQGINLVSGAASGLVESNFFTGQTNLPIVDSTAGNTITLQGNKGAANYPAGTRLTSADNLTITDAMMSQVIVVTVDAKVQTLPAAAAGKRVRVVNGGKDGAVLVNVDPADAGTLITFRGADGGAGKSLLNTKATAKSGDFVDLLGIDATHWTVADSAGIWAAE